MHSFPPSIQSVSFFVWNMIVLLHYWVKEFHAFVPTNWENQFGKVINLLWSQSQNPLFCLNHRDKNFKQTHASALINNNVFHQNISIDLVCTSFISHNFLLIANMQSMVFFSETFLFHFITLCSSYYALCPQVFIKSIKLNAKQIIASTTAKSFESSVMHVINNNKCNEGPSEESSGLCKCTVAHHNLKDYRIDLIIRIKEKTEQELKFWNAFESYNLSNFQCTQQFLYSYRAIVVVVVLIHFVLFHFPKCIHL